MSRLAPLAALAHSTSVPAVVVGQSKISATSGNFNGALTGDFFGQALAWLGDVDGIGDLAVGASRDDDGGSDRGAVWIVFLNAMVLLK